MFYKIFSSFSLSLSVSLSASLSLHTHTHTHTHTHAHTHTHTHTHKQVRGHRGGQGTTSFVPVEVDFEHTLTVRILKRLHSRRKLSWRKSSKIGNIIRVEMRERLIPLLEIDALHSHVS